jgi:hypothetical protein
MNLWQQFQQLLPTSPLIIGRVVGHNSDGTSRLLLLNDAVITVTGQNVPIGHNAFVQDGHIQNKAPNLPVYEIEI